MNHHRRLAPLAAAILVAAALVTESAASASAATPPASFVDPAPGAVVVVAPNGAFTARWTELNGSAVSGRSVLVQSSRSLGQLGCDPRWVPTASAAVSGLTATATSLVAGRCYRFALSGRTTAGTFLVTSAPLMASATPLGPNATFTNPIRSSLTVYEQRNTISWLESDALGLPIASRTLVEQMAPPVSGSCASAYAWRSATLTGVTAGRALRTFARGYCFRYQLTLTDIAGFRHTTTSGTIFVAGNLPAWTGKIDLYRSTAFASQATGTWCVAASVQMMLNLILGTSDSSSTAQSTYITYAQAYDGADYAVGSDPAGWSAALNRFGAGAYSVSKYGSRTLAINAAAKRLRLTNKPVGLLVAAGGHAWVMTGFTASADPAVTENFTVTSVYAMGPLWPRPTNSYGYDLAPDTKISMTTFAKYFTPYQDWQTANWNGYYVIVTP